MQAIAQQTTPAIAGVVNAGTKVELVKEGFEAVEGPLPMADGGLLFSNYQALQVLRVAPDGSVSIWYEPSGGANGLARTPSGDVVAAQNKDLAIAVLKPGETPRVLASEFEGLRFNRPNDVVAGRRGDIYFTDTAAMGVTNPPLPSALYHLDPKGRLTRITAAIARPNGVALSPDEHTLYLANTNGQAITAFPLDGNGVAKEGKDFTLLALPPARGDAAPSPGADGMAVDEAGRLYVATTLGVQVFSPAGEPLGIIALPKSPQNLAFSGKDRGTLYVVGRGSVYRIATLTHGPDRGRASK